MRNRLVLAPVRACTCRIARCNWNDSPVKSAACRRGIRVRGIRAEVEVRMTAGRCCGAPKRLIPSTATAPRGFSKESKRGLLHPSGFRSLLLALLSDNPRTSFLMSRRHGRVARLAHVPRARAALFTFYRACANVGHSTLAIPYRPAHDSCRNRVAARHCALRSASSLRRRFPSNTSGGAIAKRVCDHLHGSPFDQDSGRQPPLLVYLKRLFSTSRYLVNASAGSVFDAGRGDPSLARISSRWMEDQVFCPTLCPGSRRALDCDRGATTGSFIAGIQRCHLAA